MPITDKRKAYNREYSERVRRVSVTLTPSEYRELKARAKVASIRPTTLAKTCIVSGGAVSTPIPERIEEELRALRFLLRNVANNINQIAHHSNTIHRLVDENGLLEEVRKMEEAVFAWVEKQYQHE